MTFAPRPIAVPNAGSVTDESVMTNTISSMKDMTSILKDVEDEASAKAALPDRSGK